MPSSPSLAGRLLGKVSNAIGVGGRDGTSNSMARIERLGMSPRQQGLNHLWSWYRCQSYEARNVDWNGQKRFDALETEAIASGGFIPPGFYDAGRGQMPIKFRRPTAPYALVKVIVDRFTGLLFSERQHPKIQVDGDPMTKDFLNAISDVARLWQKMIEARTFGGATGSVAVGFQFVDGVPVIEVHDPRWLAPEFVDRHALVLRSIEKRYMYPVDVRNPETGRYETVLYWYRRIIDDQRDVLFKPVKVETGEEPEWQVDKEAPHGFGFCPVVWVQNIPLDGDIDGDPDCHGVYDLVESIDSLLAQANRGVLMNCDPTLAILTDSDMPADIKKGSDNAIKVPKGDVKYLEITGMGPKAALEMAETLRKYALEVVQCVLEHPDIANKTATEIERAYSSMLARADIFREQYGERCVKPIMEMIHKAATKITSTVAQGTDDTGATVMVRSALKLPPRREKNELGQDVETPMVPGNGGVIRLEWPGYFQPSLTDMKEATAAAVAAKTGGLIDAETASRFVATYFHVEDVKEMLARIAGEEAQRQAEMEAMALGGARVDENGVDPNAADGEPGTVTGMQGEFPQPQN